MILETLRVREISVLGQPLCLIHILQSNNNNKTPQKIKLEKSNLFLVNPFLHCGILELIGCLYLKEAGYRFGFSS